MLAFRLLWRNWRSGEVKILAIAIMLAVAVVSAISVFTNRLETALIEESAAFLGANRIVDSSQPIPDQWQQEAAGRFDVRQANTVEFLSMVFSDESMNMASIKAVSSGYPLLGQIELSDRPFAVDAEDIRVADGIPAPGEAWVDSRLLPLLEAELGDPVQVGDKDLRATRVIINEPDRGGGMSMVSPRLIMNLEDLPATNVIQPGSRVSYRWLLAGDEGEMVALEEWLEAQTSEHQRILSLESSQEQLANALDRGTRFLLLAGIVGVLLAGVAIAIASQQFANRHVDQVALMKSLGASARRVRGLYLFQLLYLAAMASLAGLLVGEVVQRLVSAALSSLFPVVLGGAGLGAYGVGILTGFVCLIFFALPPLWHLPRIPPLKILRREMPVRHLRAWIQGGFGVAAVLLLIFIYSGDLWLTASVFLSLAGIIGVASILALWLLRLGRQLGMHAGSVWRLALASLQRSPGQSTVQILVFATAIMLLLAMTTIRGSLLDDWQLQLPEDAPNHIFLNIAPHEREPVRQLLQKEGIENVSFSPMLRARLVAINGEAPTEEMRERNGVLRRELNLTWNAELQEDNEVVAGQWWDAARINDEQRPGAMSVEVEVAERLGLELGDTLTFSVGGLTVDVVVENFRTVNRDSFEWYFFIAAPGVLEDYSPVYRSDVFLPPGKKSLVNDVLLEHPTVMVFEFDKIIQQIRSIIDQVSSGVELVLWLVIAGGALVLVAAVNASMGNRLREAGLLRALGSSRKLIIGSVWTEFSVLGLFAGLLAVFGSEVLLLSIQHWVLEVPIQPHLHLWFVGTLLGTLSIGLLGVISCRRVVTAAPAVVLREVEG
ncbi:ABC transporter permease [Gilvimarinus sp. F26214L]|uniref:ABC transporter permease n=1 Tax=Gilvimarinus sp. DZF01 TaxID=3461371 RepID=UPI0040456FBD